MDITLVCYACPCHFYRNSVYILSAVSPAIESQVAAYELIPRDSYGAVWEFLSDE